MRRYCGLRSGGGGLVSGFFVTVASVRGGMTAGAGGGGGLADVPVPDEVDPRSTLGLRGSEENGRSQRCVPT